jgi:acyl carrier protein
MTFTLRRSVSRPEPLSGSEVLERLRDRLPAPLRVARADTLLSDLPIDSLDTVELLCLIDDEFRVRLGEETFQSLRTVGDLANEVARDAAQGER